MVLRRRRVLTDSITDICFVYGRSATILGSLVRFCELRVLRVSLSSAAVVWRAYTTACWQQVKQQVVKDDISGTKQMTVKTAPLAAWQTQPRHMQGTSRQRVQYVREWVWAESTVL